MKTARRHVAAAAMRNEGPFILEWVAWYRMLGFDDILIVTNDCTDHSPQLLDLLAQHGWLHHQGHHPAQGKSPKSSAHRAIRAHPLISSADWLFLCDSDEFLVLHIGDGTIQAFLGDEPSDVHGIAMHWQCFGTSGHTRWEDGLVHRQFTRAAREKSETNIFFKSLIHRPAAFRKLREHRPQIFTQGQWGVGPNRWVDSVGNDLSGFNPEKNDFQFTDFTDITHASAQVNHYVIRSDESFDRKRGQPDPTAGKDRYGDRFFKKYNRNEVEDVSALKYADQFDLVYRQIRAASGVERLHQLCCADYVADICRLRGENPEDDPRYRRHLKLAQDAR